MRLRAKLLIGCICNGFRSDASALEFSGNLLDTLRDVHLTHLGSSNWRLKRIDDGSQFSPMQGTASGPRALVPSTRSLSSCKDALVEPTVGFAASAPLRNIAILLG